MARTGVPTGQSLDCSTPKVNVSHILALLPQTQCTRCGYPDCEGYAHAIAQGEAEINQCPPGGAEGVRRLAQVTRQPAKSTLALNPANGQEKPRVTAWIDENWCIGCTLCMKACPVDAIVGANKKMHTIIEGDCTGCELCIPVCPLDCIHLDTIAGEHTAWSAWSQTEANKASQAYAWRKARLDRMAHDEMLRLDQLSESTTPL
jgi:Na+-translocating ferredoxin:NAD+ oxidoreductase subunit B